jgi:hypothetical protein
VSARKWWPALVLALAMIVFVVAARRLATELPVWHELVSALPVNAPRACADGGARLVVSPSRPHWSLCAGAQALPIVVSPYATGLATWPLALLHPWHAGDPFALRAIWIVIAALSLVLTYRLVRRVAGAETAALGCLLVAASAPFLIINGLLIPFETLPCTLMIAALSAWATVADPAPRPARLYAGALLAGLSLASNVKALFLLAPVIAVAWRAGVRLPRLGPRRVALLVALFLLPAVPMAVFAAIDPRHGFVQQFALRGGYLLQNLRLGRFLDEPLLLFNFAADAGSVFELAQGHGARFAAAHVAVAVPIVYCMVIGAARLAGRRWGSPLAGACGAMVLSLFLASILLYRQYPGGNYAPLHDVLGLAMAAGVIDLARRFAGARWPIAAAVGVVALGALSLALTLRRDYGRAVAFSINAVAERELGAHLRAQPSPAVVVTTTYNLTGVADALGAGRVHEASGYDALAACELSADLDACLAAAWHTLLAQAAPPVRVLAPVAAAPVDKPVEITRRIAPALTRAAGELGDAIELERTFATAGGVPVLSLYRVSPR